MPLDTLQRCIVVVKYVIEGWGCITSKNWSPYEYQIIDYIILLNSVDKENNTLLMVAAENGSIQCVKFLLKIENIDIEAQNNTRKTALGTVDSIYLPLRGCQQSPMSIANVT